LEERESLEEREEKARGGRMHGETPIASLALPLAN
jgi:hypothetical protein